MGPPHFSKKLDEKLGTSIGKNSREQSVDRTNQIIGGQTSRVYDGRIHAISIRCNTSRIGSTYMCQFRLKLVEYDTYLQRIPEWQRRSLEGNEP